MIPALVALLLYLPPDLPPCKCSTDSECMELCGGYGDPDPAWCPPPDDPYAADAFEPEYLDACAARQGKE